MAFKSNGSIIVTNDRAFDNLANVTIQNSGNLTITSADTFQGTVAGYSSGGFPVTNIIDKFPFATNSNATDVGDLGVARQEASGQSSIVSGYMSGGYLISRIDKFPFASDTNATNPGNLLTGNYNSSGQSSS